MSDLLSNPKSVISIVNWNRLKTAHRLMRQCKIRDGMTLYRKLLKNDLLRFIYDGWWGVHDTEDSPSIDWACIYLAEYYYKERLMFEWLDIFRFVEPQFNKLSAKTRSRLLTVYGWAQCLTDNHKLTEIIQIQLQALNQPGIGNFEKAQHETLLSYLFRQVRNPKKAIQFAWRSVSHLSFSSEPYYLIRARDLLASNYDMFSRYNQKYHHMAEKLHQETNRLVLELGEDAEPEQQNYNLGWHAMESKDFVSAVTYFSHGKSNMKKHGLCFEEHLNIYGLSVAFLNLGDISKAESYIKQALDFFWRGGESIDIASNTVGTVSASMTAICLYILALVYKAQGKLELSLEKALLAYKWHQHFDNPLQLSHLKRCIGEIYLQLNKSELSEQWLAKGLVSD